MSLLNVRLLLNLNEWKLMCGNETDPHSMFVTGGQLAIALLVLLSYPLQCHPCRFSLDKVLSCGSNTRLPMSKKNHVAITLGILVASFLMAISINNLSTVSTFKLKRKKVNTDALYIKQILSLVGATGSTTICYILPGLFYFKFRENTDVPGRPWDAKKIGSLVLAGMGVIVMSTSLTSQIYAMLSGRKAPGGH